MDVLLTFRTTRHAILGERLLLDASEAVRVMPLPARIAAGCGICLRAPAARRGAVAAVLARGGAPPAGCFLFSGGEYRPFPAPLFSEALGLVPGDAVAIVGCGGKTALANRLAMENRLLPVLFSTTTRIFEPPADVTDRRLAEEDGPEKILPGVNLACLPADEIGEIGGAGVKLRGFAPDALARLHSACAAAGGVSLLEADGSRGLPLKGWAGHEPAVPAFATVTVGVCAAYPAGELFRPELVHRPELFRAATGIRDGEWIGVDHLAAMVREMFRKASGRRVLFINQTEGPELERATAALAERCGGMRVAAGSVLEERICFVKNPM